MDAKRPIEPLVGRNLAMVRMIVGNMSVGESYRAVLRRARPAVWNGAPVALRRGWARAVIETHRENRDVYRRVMGGAL